MANKSIEEFHDSGAMTAMSDALKKHYGIFGIVLAVLTFVVNALLAITCLVLWLSKRRSTLFGLMSHSGLIGCLYASIVIPLFVVIHNSQFQVDGVLSEILCRLFIASSTVFAGTYLYLLCMVILVNAVTNSPAARRREDRAQIPTYASFLFHVLPAFIALTTTAMTFFISSQSDASTKRLTVCAIARTMPWIFCDCITYIVPSFLMCGLTIYVLNRPKAANIQQLRQAPVAATTVAVASMKQKFIVTATCILLCLTQLPLACVRIADAVLFTTRSHKRIPSRVVHFTYWMETIFVVIAAFLLLSLLLTFQNSYRSVRGEDDHSVSRVESAHDMDNGFCNSEQVEILRTNCIVSSL